MCGCGRVVGDDDDRVVVVVVVVIVVDLGCYRYGVNIGGCVRVGYECETRERLVRIVAMMVMCGDDDDDCCC